ncbi:MAG: hypothetical protein WBC44_13060 [Planctomycetaceae bacterium]
MLRRSELEAIEEGLGALESATASFPFADLTVTTSYRSRRDEYHIKTRLALPGRVIFTGEHDTVALPAYERCLRKLVHKADAYLQQLNRNRPPGVSPGRPLSTATAPNLADRTAVSRQRQRLKQACDDRDYHAFRQELADFDELIRRRVGHWVRRYSDVDAAFVDATVLADEELPLDDLVEEISLTAFERYPSKPQAMRTGDWLESLIDPAMRSFLSHPDEELEAISFARTLHEMHDDRFRGDAEGAEFGSPRDRDDPSRDGDLFRRPR